MSRCMKPPLPQSHHHFVLRTAPLRTRSRVSPIVRNFQSLPLRLASTSASAEPPSDASTSQRPRRGPDKERAGRRVLFTLADWRKHRSKGRYLHHLRTLVESGVVRGIVMPVLLVTLLTAAVAGYNLTHELAPHVLPAWAPSLPSVAIEPIQLTSFALSLLLVFRTNASYSRFMDARSSFGRITTTSRDIARQAFFWFSRPEDLPYKAMLARWLVALAKSTMFHLRDEHTLHNELKDVLQPEELEQELLHRIDENVGRLLEAVQSCDRIINTPIPLSYTRHTSRFLIAWLAALPFCLWRYCHVAMVPIAALIAFVLLGIEEIGVYIEEPFSVLPLEALCNTLQGTLATMLRESGEIIALRPKVEARAQASMAAPIPLQSGDLWKL